VSVLVLVLVLVLGFFFVFLCFFPAIAHLRFVFSIACAANVAPPSNSGVFPFQVIDANIDDLLEIYFEQLAAGDA
jgi:hypothetical protein